MDEVIGFAWANSSKAGLSADKTAPTIKASKSGEPAVVIGFDVYNMASTGSLSKTLNSAATDTDHIPGVCYDARGNGGRGCAPTLTGDHENRITDYTSIVVIDHSRRHSYQALNVFPTMEAHMGTGGGNVPLVLMRGESDAACVQEE